MIVELVFFDLPDGTTRDGAVTLYQTSAGKWAANPDLIDKYYFFDESRCLGGGVYIWPSREAAQRWHGEDYVTTVEKVYGCKPRIQFLDAVIHVNPISGLIDKV